VRKQQLLGSVCIVALLVMGITLTSTPKRALAGGSTRLVCLNYNGMTQCSSAAGDEFNTNCTNYNFGTGDSAEFGIEGEIASISGDLVGSWAGTLYVTDDGNGDCSFH
jgi:hypothetical protein